MAKFIKLRLRSYTICHGYDAAQKEILEEVRETAFSNKIVAIDRIKSISERSILTDYAHGRWIYWEYEGGIDALAAKLEKQKLLEA